MKRAILALLLLTPIQVLAVNWTVTVTWDQQPDAYPGQTADIEWKFTPDTAWNRPSPPGK